MDTATIMLLISIIGCFLGLAGWLARRDNKNVSDATWKGEINGKLDAILGINIRIDKVECKMEDATVKIAKLESKADSAHKRIDEHLTRGHE